MKTLILVLLFLVFLNGCNSGGGESGGSSLLETNNTTNNTNSSDNSLAFITKITHQAEEINSSKNSFEFSVHFNKKISVYGCTPSVWINIGSDLHLGIYRSGTGSSIHTYAVSFPAEKVDLDGPEVLSPLKFSKGCMYETDGTIQNEVNSEFESTQLTRITINQIGPEITNFKLTPSSGSHVVGSQLNIDVIFSEIVNAENFSSLSFKLNNQLRSASYLSGSGTKTLSYSYTLKNSDKGLAQFLFSHSPSDIKDANLNNPRMPKSSTEYSLTVLSNDISPIAYDLSGVSITEDVMGIVNLNYTDSNGDLASSCRIANLSNLTIIQPCSCRAGVCSVGVKGFDNYNGVASFSYSVTANEAVSNEGIVNLSITPVNDPFVVSDILLAPMSEDVSSTILLPYSDIESNLATSCSLSNIVNFEITTPCTCNSGTCSVAMRGTSNFSGEGSFSYSVSGNGITSNLATVSGNIAPIDDAPEAQISTAPSIQEEESTTVELPYSDVELDKATSCSVSNLIGILADGNCSCINGICSINVTGITDFSGLASLNYTVTANGLESNLGSTTIEITPIDDAPVTDSLNLPDLTEDVPSIITLSYTDNENDQATSCELTNLNNIILTSPCSCNAGICTAEISGSENYSGEASFDFSVTANSQTSNVSNSTFNITPVDDAPVSDLTVIPTFNEDTETIVTLSYSDAEGDTASTCSISNLNNVTETTPCLCISGICTVGITGTSNFEGPISFDYTVSSNTLTSNTSTVNSFISGIDDPAVSDNLSASLIEDIEKIITLSYSDPESNPATECSLTNLSQITESTPCTCNSGICTVGVTGINNYFGPASFDYLVVTNGVNSNISTSNLTIDPVDDGPTGETLTIDHFTEDLEKIITLSYVDIEGDLATTCSISGALNIFESTPCSCASGVCSVGLTGSEDYYGNAEFNFSVSTNGLTSIPVTVPIIVDPVDDAPIANDLTPPPFNEDTISTINFSYTDAEGDLATSCQVSSENNITFETSCFCSLGNCSVDIKGASGYFGPADFTYTITTGLLVSNSAFVNLTITAIDDAPVANTISSISFNEDSSQIITLDYSDQEADLATTCSISDLNNIFAVNSCQCSLGVCTAEVQGNQHYNGSASFEYTVTANGLTSNSATASLNIIPVDDAPIADTLPTQNLLEDTSILINLTYQDIENDLATICNTSNLVNVSEISSCQCSAGLCSVEVRPISNYSGPASFQYTLTANGLSSELSTVNLNITSLDDPPIAIDLNAISPLEEDIESVITLAYSDIENDVATNCTLSNLVNITISQNCTCSSGICTVGIKGIQNYNGPGSFNFSVNANSLESNIALATFDINPVDDAPIGENLFPPAFNEDSESTIILSYSDLENDLANSCNITDLMNVSISSPCSCNSGICSVGVKGDTNFFGNASFKFSVSANGLTSIPKLANLTINSVDDASVATNLNAPDMNEGSTSIVVLSYTDIEGDLATTCQVSNLVELLPASSCTCNNGLCYISITASNSYNGPATFDFTVTSNGLTSNIASASLNITPIDDSPIAQNIGPVDISEDTASIISLNYIDEENDLATECSISNLNNVQITQPCSCSNGICNVEVSGFQNYNGAASFNYTVVANGKNSNIATASLNILAIDDAPISNVINPPSFNEDTPSIITLSYTDPENDLAVLCEAINLNNISIISPCSCNNGVCTVEVQGIQNFNGNAKFDFKVTANSLTSNVSSANLVILPIDDAPVASNILISDLQEDVQRLITLSYSDMENDLASSCSTFNPSNINFTSTCSCNSGVCTVSVIGNENYSGSASFDYIILSNSIFSNTATASLTINPVNDPPLADVYTAPSFNEDFESIIQLTYTDPENDLATSCSVNNLSNLQITRPCSCVDGACSIGVKGNLNFNGPGNFQYTITAFGQNSNLGMINYNIVPVDDAPVVSNINPPPFNEDTESIITLPYTDVELDQATSCQISSLFEVFITQPCTCSSGTCTVGIQGNANYNGFASFDFKISAGLDSNTATASLSILPVSDLPTPENSNIIGSGPVIANGVATSTITITLRDSSNAGITGIIPTFSATDTNSTNVYGDCSSSDSSGVSTCTLSSTVAEIKTLSITSPITKLDGSVEFTSGNAVAVNSTIIGTGPVVADGISTSMVTITLKDAFNNPVMNMTPTFKATNTGSKNSYSSCTVTNSNGVSNCTMTSTKAEIKTLTLMTPVNKTGGTIDFIAGAADIAHSDITGTSPVSSDGISVSFINISLGDAFGNPVKGVVPLFNATDTNSTNTYGECSPTDNAGSSTCTLSSTKAEDKDLLLISPIALLGSEIVTFSATLPVSANSSIIGTGPVLADGNEISTVTITLKDLNNNGVSGITPSFDATNTGTMNTYNECSISDNGGVSECTFSSKVSETKTLRITNPVLKSGGTVDFIAGDPVALYSTISGSGPVVANGVESSNISIILKDINKNLVPGVIPTIGASGTNNFFSTCSLSDSSGLSTCTLRSTKAENKTPQILSPITKTGTAISFVAGPAVADTSTITGTGPVVPNGIETSTVTITLKDIYSNLVTGITPTYLVSGSQNILGDCSPTNTNGQSTCTFASTFAELKTLSINSPVTKVGGNVEFKVGAAFAANCTISASGPIVADGAESAIVTITLKDASNLPLLGITPQFSASGTNNTLSPCSESDSSGISTCTISSTKAELKNLQITDPISKIGPTLEFIPGPASDLTSTIEATGPVLADGVEQSTVSIYLKDAFENPIVGETPTFEMSGTLNTLDECSPSDSSGLSICYASSTKPEEKTFSLSNPIVKVGNSVDFNPNGINIQVPIEMVDLGLASNTTATTFLKTQTSLDTNDYISEENRYFFEIVAQNTATAAANVNLVNSNNVDIIDSIISVPQSTAMTRFRVEWNPTNGFDVYSVKLAKTSTSNTLKVHSAKIIVQQTKAIATKLYFPLLGGTGTSDTRTTTTSVTTTTSTSYTQTTNSFFHQFKRNDSVFSSYAPGTPWTLETVTSISNKNGTASVALYNKSTNSQIIPATTNQTGSTAITLKQASFASDTLNFTDGSIYDLKLKSSSTSYTNRLFKAGLWVKLKFLTKAEIYYRMATRRVTTTTASVTDFRYLFEQDMWTNPQVFFETIGNVNTTSVELIEDTTNNSTIGLGTLPGSNLVQPSSYGVVRSNELTLTDQYQYFIKHIRTSGTPNLGGAFIVIRASE